MKINIYETYVAEKEAYIWNTETIIFIKNSDNETATLTCSWPHLWRYQTDPIFGLQGYDTIVSSLSLTLCNP